MKKITLRKSQKKVIDELEEGLKTHSSAVLCATCGFGKMFLALFFMKKIIGSGKRVAISTYSMVEIRLQWILEAIDTGIINVADMQVICARKDLAQMIKLGIPAVTNGNVCKTKPVTIFIPQSMSKSDVGKFDYIFIDEAHEYLDVDGGKLKKIIKTHSKKSTKIIGLTGTGFRLIAKGGYFEKGFTVIYDMPTALKDGGIIMDCLIRAIWFDFKLNSTHYDVKGNLNKSGRLLLKNKSIMSLKLESLLRKMIGKTLIVAPHALKHVSLAKPLVSFINSKFPGSCVLNISGIKNAEKNEKEFRFNKNVKFMVVIDKCRTGWNFDMLNNIIDLTFTKNPMRIIQLLSRLIRFPEDKNIKKPIPKYFYCADSTKSEDEVRFYLGRALELTTKTGIENYDHMVAFDPKKRNKSGESFSKKGDIEISIISRYYRLHELSLKSSKTILRRKLSEVNDDIFTKHNPIFGPLVIAQKDGKFVMETFKDLLRICECDLLKSLKLVKRRFPDEWKKINGTERPEAIAIRLEY